MPPTAREPLLMSNPVGPGPHQTHRVLTANEVATWLGLSEPTVIQHVPNSRIGNEYRFWRASVCALFPEVEPVDDDDDAGVITIEELAARLRLSTPTVRARIEDKSIPATRIGKAFRIYWPTIRDRLAQGKDFAPPQD